LKKAAEPCIFPDRLNVIAALAQTVEQRTENPCVRSSILRGGIQIKGLFERTGLFGFQQGRIELFKGLRFGSVACCSAVCEAAYNATSQ
jgi:hypothetical protein